MSHEFGVLLGVQWVCSFDALSYTGFFWWQWIWLLHLAVDSDACEC